MDVDEFVEGFFRRLGDRGVIAVSGIVNEVVETSRSKGLQRLLHLFDEKVQVAYAAGVELEGNTLRSMCLDGGNGCFGFCLICAIGEDHVHAAPCQAFDRVAADAAAAAGDDCDLAR